MKENANEDLTKRVMNLLLQNKVFLASGANFGAERPGVFRMVFSQPKPYLEEALKRVVEALGLDTAISDAVQKAEMLELGKSKL